MTTPRRRRSCPRKNPDTLELVRAVAGDAAGGVQGLTTTLKGLPRAYNRDLQRATPHAWETVDAVTEASEVAAGAVATADWNEETLAAEAGEGFSTATGVADLLAANGLPFRTAHELVAVAAERGADYDALEAAAQEVLGESLEAHVDPVAVADALDPAESVASRDSQGARTRGGRSPARVGPRGARSHRGNARGRGRRARGGTRGAPFGGERLCLRRSLERDGPVDPRNRRQSLGPFGDGPREGTNYLLHDMSK